MGAGVSVAEVPRRPDRRASGLLVAVVVFRDHDRTVAGRRRRGGWPPTWASRPPPRCPRRGSARRDVDPDGRADETVVITSLARTDVDATITVMPGGEDQPVSRTVPVDGASRNGACRRRARDAGAGRDRRDRRRPGRGRTIRGGDDVAIEPCARDRTDWYFASGTTVRGTQQDLALFNPFGDDAIVDVAFLTDTGVLEPDPVQGGGRAAPLAPRHPGARPRAPPGRRRRPRAHAPAGSSPSAAGLRRHAARGRRRDGVSLSVGAAQPAHVVRCRSARPATAPTHGRWPTWLADVDRRGRGGAPR